MVSANRARGYLMQFVRTAFGPTDIVGFMDPLTPIDAIHFTRDRLELAEHVRHLVGRSGVYVPTRSGVEDAHLQQGEVERLRSEVTVSAVKSAVVHLGGIRDGRKALILVSEGLRGIQRDLDPAHDRPHPRGQRQQHRHLRDRPAWADQQRFPSVWEPMAGDTGGDFYRSNDLDQAFRQVVIESSGFYLLGYAPTERRLGWTLPQDPGPGEALGARRARAQRLLGAERRRDRARPGQAAEAEIPPDMVRALSELPGTNARRTMDFWAGHGGRRRTPDRQAVVGAAQSRVAGSARPAQVTAVVTQGETRIFEGPVSSSGVSFPAPSGALKVTFTVLDATNEIIDRDVRTIDVPDLAGPALSVTTPALFRSQNVREFRSLDRGPNATPFAGREFERTDRLLIRFEVHGTAAATATVTARIISQWGKDLAELPFLPRPDGTGPYEIDLPLSTVARGDYLIAMAATAGADRARAFVPIRVVR